MACKFALATKFKPGQVLLHTMQLGYVIYLNALLEGAVPAVRDENGKPCVFSTRVEAEREIADNMIIRLQEFIDGERDFEDAMTVEEYVVEVTVPDGTSFH